MMRLTCFSSAGLILVLLLAFPPQLTAAEAAGEEAVFDLEEFPVFLEPEHSPLLRGQCAFCQDEPAAEVKKYPALHSKHPWYGEVIFGKDGKRPESGTKFYFVVDESTPADRQELKEVPSGLQKLTDVLSGKTETKETLPAKITYDRLYFDLNHDLDLTNDPVLEPQINPPANALPRWTAKQKVAFSELAVRFDCGPGVGEQAVKIMPRLMVGEREGKVYANLSFVAVRARRGEIQFGTQDCRAVVGQSYLIAGRFDGGTYLQLTPLSSDDRNQEYWWGNDSSNALRWSDGRFYTTRVTPSGDKLFVKPYTGDLGTFRIGPGDRKLEKVGVSGSLYGKDAAVPVGDYSGKLFKQTEVEECQLPVGDYMPASLNIQYGKLRIFLSNNYHANGQPRKTSQECVYGIKIRKDEPFVLDFSNKPEVLFASPAKDQTFHPGDEIKVKAVLIDPVLDIMIRRLEDTTREKKEVVNVDDKQTVTTTRPLSLDPTVTITDSSGKTVAEGTLPFG